MVGIKKISIFALSLLMAGTLTVVGCADPPPEEPVNEEPIFEEEEPIFEEEEPIFEEEEPVNDEEEVENDEEEVENYYEEEEEQE